MVKKICDICGKEVTFEDRSTIESTPETFYVMVDEGVNTKQLRQFDLCLSCTDNLAAYINDERSYFAERRKRGSKSRNKRGKDIHYGQVSR